VAEIAEEAAEAAEAAPVVDAAPPVLRVVDATLRGRDGRPLLDRLSLEVRAGEIVGVAGVEGNGQLALGDLLSSLLTLDAGRVEVDGVAVTTGKAGAMA